MAVLVDKRTENLGLPLPNTENDMADDCLRIAESIQGIDKAYGEVRLKAADAVKIASEALEAAQNIDTSEIDRRIAQVEDLAVSALGTANRALEAAQNIDLSEVEGKIAAVEDALVKKLPETVAACVDEKLPGAITTALPGELEKNLPAILEAALPGIVEEKLPGVVEGQLVNSETLNGIIQGKVDAIIDEKIHNGEITGNTPAGPDGAITARAPSFAAPAAGVTVYASGGVTAMLNAFSVVVANETHVATDWLVCLDSARQNVIASAGESKDLLEHSFTGLEWTPDTTYYLFARFRTENGVSPWSAAHAIRPVSGVASAYGRVLYRHSSGMGTVMEYSDGLPRKILIVDAKYRKYGLACQSPASLPSLRKDVSQRGVCLGTDAAINDFFNANDIMDPNTARQNTDAADTSNTGTAQGHCRAQLVGGVGCDLPNIQQLARIVNDRYALDSLDPTVGAYPELALCCSTYDRCSSSKSAAANYPVVMMRVEQMWKYSTAGNGGYAVVPILELA